MIRPEVHAELREEDEPVTEKGNRDVSSLMVKRDTLCDVTELKAWLGRDLGRTVTLDEVVRTAVREALVRRRTVREVPEKNREVR